MKKKSIAPGGIFFVKSTAKIKQPRRDSLPPQRVIFKTKNLRDTTLQHIFAKISRRSGPVSLAVKTAGLSCLRNDSLGRQLYENIVKHGVCLRCRRVSPSPSGKHVHAFSSIQNEEKTPLSRTIPPIQKSTKSAISRDGSRTRTPVKERDFKSRASAIPPLGHKNEGIIMI